MSKRRGFRSVAEQNGDVGAAPNDRMAPAGGGAHEKRQLKKGNDKSAGAFNGRWTQEENTERQGEPQGTTDEQ